MAELPSDDDFIVSADSNIISSADGEPDDFIVSRDSDSEYGGDIGDFIVSADLEPASTDGDFVVGNAEIPEVDAPAENDTLAENDESTATISRMPEDGGSDLPETSDPFWTESDDSTYGGCGECRVCDETSPMVASAPFETAPGHESTEALGGTKISMDLTDSVESMAAQDEIVEAGANTDAEPAVADIDGGRSDKCPGLKMDADPEARELMASTTECAITVDGPVCSGQKMIDVVEKFVETTAPDGPKPTQPLEIIDAARQVTGCPTEECVLRTIADQQPAAAALVKETISTNFLVDGPADSCKWLNNKNIDDVLKQLCHKFTKLYHMDYHMINFDTINDPQPLHKLDMYNDVIAAGFDTFCVVINTDRYGNPGVHWFCLFGDFRRAGSQTDPYTIEYFNSSGAAAPQSVSRFLVKTKYNIEAVDDLHVQLVPNLKSSTIQHQKDTDSECGVYCLYYIYNRVAGKIAPNPGQRIPDARMVAFRRKIFKNRAKSPPT